MVEESVVFFANCFPKLVEVSTNETDNFLTGSGCEKRLTALETKAAQENLILTEDQLRALERAREEKQAHGEIETEHPGYLGAQDTYYVGTIKSIGRIYQQTFLDTYSKLAFAKLYDRKNALVAADLLNDRVLPFLEEQNVSLVRVLTDRGTEYCGNRESHEYQLYLAVENIDHSRTKTKSPQTNGICERFHRTLQEEFYSVAFRKKRYTRLEELQSDLDVWLREYNEKREYSDKYCYGKTPWQTFPDSKHLAQAKMLDALTTTASSDVEVRSAEPERKKLPPENDFCQIKFQLEQIRTGCIVENREQAWQSRLAS